MSVETIQVEMMLLKWSEDSTNGGIVRLQVTDIEPFKALTEAKGKKAGQRFMAVLALIGDVEQPEKLPTGPLCRLAALWCREPQFQAWLAQTWPVLWNAPPAPMEANEESAKRVVCHICGVTSRKMLDHNSEAKAAFNELIRRPFMDQVAKVAKNPVAAAVASEVRQP